MAFLLQSALNEFHSVSVCGVKAQSLLSPAPSSAPPGEHRGIWGLRGVRNPFSEGWVCLGVSSQLDMPKIKLRMETLGGLSNHALLPQLAPRSMNEA